MKLWTSLLFLFLTIDLVGQPPIYKRPKPKNSFGQGTLDISVGFNNSVFSKSNIQFSGNSYDFKLLGVAAEDKQTLFSWDYLNPLNINQGQFNLRVGYNIKNFWNIALAWDRMHYQIRDGQSNLIEGTIDSHIDPEWVGTFDDGQERPIDHNDFYYGQNRGLNFLRVQVSRNLAPIEDFRSGALALNWLYGASGGVLLSSTDYLFSDQRATEVSSLSGYGLSLDTGVRLIILKNLFIQGNVVGGFMHQFGVSTSPNGSSSARHAFWYGSTEALAGFLWYIKPTNDCNSCPIW